GARTWENAQPTLGPTASGTLALGHNGNLTNTRALIRLAAERYGVQLPDDGDDCASDTTVLTALLHGDAEHTLAETAMDVLPQLRGAFSLAFMTENTLYAARDPQGIRPLVLGRLERGWVVASETAALDIIGAAFVREIDPGELLVIDADGLHSQRFAEARPKGCVFEYVYLARPDTTIAGRSVNAARVEMGRTLAPRHPIEPNLLLPAPKSGQRTATGNPTEQGTQSARELPT